MTLEELREQMRWQEQCLHTRAQVISWTIVAFTIIAVLVAVFYPA